MKIMIMRHTDALSRTEADVPYDADRPLSETGRQHAADVGRFLQTNHLRIDTVLCSPFIRTQECAGLICNELPSSVTPLPLTILAPGSGTNELLTAGRDYVEAGDRWMLAVLHEPDVSHILDNLLFDGQGCPFTIYQGDLIVMTLEVGNGVTKGNFILYYSPKMRSMVPGFGESGDTP